MANAKLLQASLSAGEISPSLYGRVDMARYAVGLRKCRNWIVRPYGGVENRAGFRHVAGVGTAGATHRAIPFVFSDEVAYVIVLGDGHARFFSNGAPVAPATVPYSAAATYNRDNYVTYNGVTYRSLQHGNIAHTPNASPTWWVADSGLYMTAPWSADKLWQLKFTQSADVLYVVHPDMAPREFRRVTPSLFETRVLETRDGPFLDLNTDESMKVSADAVQGTVILSATGPMFRPEDVGSLIYIEPENIGQIKPWVVGDRSVTLNQYRRSDGKTYKAVQIPAAGTWHETGPRTPIHESGRAWDGAGDTKTNGADTWSVGILWEYVDSGYGVALITGYTAPNQVTAVVTRKLAQGTTGGLGAVVHTWNLVGDGVTKTFGIAVPPPTYGIYTVLMNGVLTQADPNFVPPNPLAGVGNNGGSISRPGYSEQLP